MAGTSRHRSRRNRPAAPRSHLPDALATTGAAAGSEHAGPAAPLGEQKHRFRERPTAGLSPEIPPPAQGEPFSLTRIPALDGLRGVAILLVLACHADPPPLPGGFVGVDLFFVLSGFLITSLLLRERRLSGRISLRRFYVRRALRLLPALYALVSVCLIYTYFERSPKQFSDALVVARAVVLYFYNWHAYVVRSLQTVPMFGHLWSLSIEEQFYFIWPILLILLLKLGFRRIPLYAIVLVGLVAPAIARPILWHREGNILLAARTDLRADALLFGAAIAFAVEGRMAAGISRRWRLALQVGLAVALCTLAANAVTWKALSPDYLYRWGYPLIDCCAMLVVAATVCCPPSRWRRLLESPPLRWLGRISYGAYLWHYPIFVLIVFPPAALVGGPLWFRSELAVGLTLVVASISYYGLEQPILRWRERKTPERARSVVPVPGLGASISSSTATL
jgi:peptidoglycan/LPS O-acetylase OafA/YrhL